MNNKSAHQLVFWLTCIVCNLFFIIPSFAYTEEENCKSARSSLEKQVTKNVTGIKRVNVINLNTLKQISVLGPDGNAPGYQCWATVVIWTGPSNTPKTIRVIYTVFNASQFQGIPISYSAVGIDYICGESDKLDEDYSVCRE